MMANPPQVLCFVCRFGYGYAAEPKSPIMNNGQIVPVLCCGKIEAEFVLDALRDGISGVLILACGEDECHFQDGVVQCYKRLLLLKEVLKSFGLSAQRLKMVTGCDPEGTSIGDHIDQFRTELISLKHDSFAVKQGPL